jgi:membrane-bound lytic murein transglycosylase D
VKTIRIVLLLCVVSALVGCAGVATDLPLDSARPVAGSESPEVLAALEAADAAYREALDHYVVDRREEAVDFLERALLALDAIDPVTEDALTSAASLESRIYYFLNALGETDRAIVHRRARVDTATVGVGAGARPVATTIPLHVNDRVEKWLDYFQGKGRREMQRWLGRSGRYRPMIESILEEEGLPSELFYLAVIESGLNPNAYSRAHACGMWQFISSRARLHGLRVDWWVDERRDPEKSTRAAADYLKELYGMFGCWELALAGYNSGEGRVARAQKKRPSCEDYWCLDLPRETENFVPKFIAATLIGQDPEAYGFSPPKKAAPLSYDSIEISEATDLSVVADAASVPADEIKALNPAIRRWCTAPDGPPTVVRVPRGTGPRCLAAVASIPESQRVTWRRHRVSRGETLSEIASHYGTSVRGILSVNDIRNPHRIHPGDYVVIPIGPSAPPGTADFGDTVVYTVSRGDTITSIARRFGKRTKDVLRWNGLGWNSRIYPGDVITIHNM